MFEEVKIKLKLTNWGTYFEECHLRKLSEIVSDPKEFVSNPTESVYSIGSGKDIRTLSIGNIKYVGSCEAGIGFIYFPDGTFYVVSPYDYDSIKSLDSERGAILVNHYPVDRIFAIGDYNKLNPNRNYASGMVITSINLNHFMVSKDE